MKRASFLRSLIALPFAPAAAKVLFEEPKPSFAGVSGSTIDSWQTDALDTNVMSMLQRIAWPALRYDIPDARITKLAQTGDAQKWLIEMQGRSGVWVRKHIIMGGFFLVVTPDRAGRNSELAYQLCKRATECARDIAHIEGIDYRTNEWQWRTNGR
jgi:hypothetical protein